VGEWEKRRKGEREKGRMGEWEKRRKGEREKGRVGEEATRRRVNSKTLKGFNINNPG